MSEYFTNLTPLNKANSTKKLRPSMAHSHFGLIEDICQNPQRSSGDLSFVTKVFYIVFFSFSSHCNSKIKEFLSKFFEHGTTLIVAYVILSDLFSIYNVIDILPMGLTFSSLVTDFCSFTIRIVLLYKKKSMMLAMNFIQENYSSFCKRNVRSRRLKLLIAFSACFVMPIMDYVYVITICFENTFYVQDFLFGWSPENHETACYILFCINVVTMNQQYALPGFAVVLCCYIFGVIRRFVDEFGRQLNLRNDIQDIQFYIKYSRIIYTCIEKLEDSFSILLVFLFGYMIFSIFNVTTFLVRINYEKTDFFEDILSNFITLIMLLPAFFIMSLRATSINDAAVRVKRTVNELVAKLDVSEQAQSNLLLQMADDFSDRVVVTGWGFFALKRSFIQGTAGVMITYSIVLSQLGK